MARKNELPVGSATETIIGAGVKIKGTIVSDSDVSIDGRLDGEVKASGNVQVGPNGIIRADITATSVNVAGQLKGNIEATGETTIASTGKVTGNISTGVIGIDPGAMFIGKVTMTKTEIRGINEDEDLDDGGQA